MRLMIPLYLVLALAACTSPATPAAPIRETVLVVVTATPQSFSTRSASAGAANPVSPARATQAVSPVLPAGNPDYERGLYMAAGPVALDIIAGQQSQLKGCAERSELPCACGIELADRQALLDELNAQAPSDRFSAFHDDLSKVLAAWQDVRKEMIDICKTRDAKALSAAAGKLRAMEQDVNRALEDWDALRSEG